MLPARPPPSKAAVHALRGIVFGTSCSLVIVADERHRRAKAARTVIDNGRLLRSQKCYSPGGTAAIISRYANSLKESQDLVDYRHAESALSANSRKASEEKRIKIQQHRSPTTLTVTPINLYMHPLLRFQSIQVLHPFESRSRTPIRSYTSMAAGTMSVAEHPATHISNPGTKTEETAAEHTQSKSMRPRLNNTSSSGSTVVPSKKQDDSLGRTGRQLQLTQHTLTTAASHNPPGSGYHEAFNSLSRTLFEMTRRWGSAEDRLIALSSMCRDGDINLDDFLAHNPLSLVEAFLASAMASAPDNGKEQAFEAAAEVLHLHFRASTSLNPQYPSTSGTGRSLNLLDYAEIFDLLSKSLGPPGATQCSREFLSRCHQLDEEWSAWVFQAVQDRIHAWRDRDCLSRWRRAGITAGINLVTPGEISAVRLRLDQAQDIRDRPQGLSTQRSEHPMPPENKASAEYRKKRRWRDATLSTSDRHSADRVGALLDRMTTHYDNGRWTAVLADYKEASRISSRYPRELPILAAKAAVQSECGFGQMARNILETEQRRQGDISHIVSPLLMEKLRELEEYVETLDCHGQVYDIIQNLFREYRPFYRPNHIIYNRAIKILLRCCEYSQAIRLCVVAAKEEGNGDPIFNEYMFANLVFATTARGDFHLTRAIIEEVKTREFKTQALCLLCLRRAKHALNKKISRGVARKHAKEDLDWLREGILYLEDGITHVRDARLQNHLRLKFGGPGQTRLGSWANPSDTMRHQLLVDLEGVQKREENWATDVAPAKTLVGLSHTTFDFL